MAKKDVASIDYFGDRERFADLFNVYYFAGEQMTKSEDVREKPKHKVIFTMRCQSA